VARSQTTSPLAADARLEPAPVARLGEVLREIVRGGLAGAIAGVVVGGIGGRIIMRIAALISPDAIGFRTESGAVIGAITAEGTLGVLVFGGLFGGVVAGVIWVVVSPWIPGSGWRRWILAMPLAVALGGFFLTRSDNPDFAVLGPNAPILALLLALVGLIGAAIAWLDELLDRRLPQVATRALAPILGFGLVAIIGALFLPLAIAFFTTRQGCGCTLPPELTGWALVTVGVATAAWWALRIVAGRQDPPAALLVAGRVALLAATILGLAHLIPEVTGILSSG
jgi:hypothetical protein